MSANDAALSGGTVSLTDELTYVPDDEYDLSFIDWETKVMFKRSKKLYLHFQITSLGEHFEKPLVMYFNAFFDGGPRKRGNFKVGPKSDFARMFANVFQWNGRLDRVPMSKLKDVILVGRTRTVSIDRRQETIPVPCHYSVVDRIISVKPR